MPVHSQNPELFIYWRGFQAVESSLLCSCSCRALYPFRNFSNCSDEIPVEDKRLNDKGYGKNDSFLLEEIPHFPSWFSVHHRDFHEKFLVLAIHFMFLCHFFSHRVRSQFTDISFVKSLQVPSCIAMAESELVHIFLYLSELIINHRKEFLLQNI